MVHNVAFLIRNEGGAWIGNGAYPKLTLNRAHQIVTTLSARRLAA